jgi:hypothetical protein
MNASTVGLVMLVATGLDTSTPPKSSQSGSVYV